MNNGKSFERYVHYVYDSLLNLRGERVQVSQRTVFRISESQSYEIDIYYEFSHVGVRHRVAIECKDWKRPVDQGQVLSFHQKIKNIGDAVVGVFVSRNGYQSGALAVAERHGILLLTEEDLPTLAQLLGKKLTAAFFPDENCVGEPFWHLVRLSETGEPTDDHYALPEVQPVKVLLFIGREYALAYQARLQDGNSFRVYGMSQYKLRAFLSAALIRNLPIGLVLDYPDADGHFTIRVSDAKTINDDFLLTPIAHQGPKPLAKWLSFLRPRT